MKLSRRSFLKLSGAATAGALLARGVTWAGPRLHALAETKETLPPPGSRWVATSCLACDKGGCGIMVRVVEGRAVKIEGNPFHPINKGGTCVRCQASLQALYNPDRIKAPMRRVGERGAGQWQRLTWPEALDLVVARLREIRERGEPHTLAFLSGDTQGTMKTVIARFLEAFGTPNNLSHDLTTGMMMAHYLTHGVADTFGYDLENANYVLNFGSGFTEWQDPLMGSLWAYGRMRRGRPGRRTKIVNVDTRLSVSAAKADEWIPVRPGTEGALALGLAHVMVREGLYDRDFVARQCFGFEDWVDASGRSHAGFKTLVLRDYPPEAVARLTGVPRDVIERLAGEFATYRPALALSGSGADGYSNGIYNQMAIHALNALVGNIGAVGGIRPEAKLPPLSLPAVPRDAIAEAGLAQPRLDQGEGVHTPLGHGCSHAFPEAVLQGKPYPANVLFLYYSNPVFSYPQGSRFQEAFQKVPFIVSFSPFLDDSTVWADLILPDPTFLERWQDAVAVSLSGTPVAYGLVRPAVDPLYDTANTGDVLLRIAEKLGGTVAEALPWSSLEEAVQEQARALFRNHGSNPGAWEEYWRKVQDKGGDWDSKLGAGPLYATASGKFEFYSQNLEQKLKEEARGKGNSPEEALGGLLREMGIQAQGDAVFLPHYEPPRFSGEERDFPLHLITYKPMTYAVGSGANLPWLQELHSPLVHRSWGSWVEINPETARELGIRDGDEVWVESPLGRLKTRAEIFAGAMPDAVNMPLGQGHAALGRWAQGRGVNPNAIIAPEREPLAGLDARFSTRVRVYKA